MTTIYVPKRAPRRPRRLRGARVVAGVLVGAAAFAGIGAALDHGPAHKPAAAVVAHELHHDQAAHSKLTPVHHKAGRHHLLRDLLMAHRLLRLHRVHRVFRPWRRHWVLRRIFWRFR